MSNHVSNVTRSSKDSTTGNKPFLIDRIKAMKRQETVFYLYNMYVQPSQKRQSDEDRLALYAWREKICHWSYSVIDHFELSRHTVAISLNLFDRYLATRGNKCDGSGALLTSLTTLYIAVKIHESKKIKLSTLIHLSRGQFKARDIEKMEIKILKALSWLVHPPTALDFVYDFSKLIPNQIRPPVRHKIFELSRYTAELSVCDPFFIEYPPSLIAFAAVLNVLEYEIDFDCFPAGCREKYLSDLYTDINLHRGRSAVRNARDRLQTTLTASGMMYGTEKTNSSTSKPSWDKPDEQMRMASSLDSTGSKGSWKSFSSFGSKGSRSLSRSRRFKSPRNGSLVIPC